MNGWIKIERDITSHWIFQDSWKFRNWIDLLTMVNYQDKKIELNGQIFVCKPWRNFEINSNISHKMEMFQIEGQEVFKVVTK